MNHTCKIDDDDWDFLAKFYSMPNPGNKIRRIVHDGVNGLRSGGVNGGTNHKPPKNVSPEAVSPEAVSPQTSVPPEASKEDKSQKSLFEFCDDFDLTPEDFEHDPMDDEEEYQHIRFKKKAIKEGYRGEGMNDPSRTMEFWAEDIRSRISLNRLSDGALASLKISSRQYRRWKLEKK